MSPIIGNNRYFCCLTLIPIYNMFNRFLLFITALFLCSCQAEGKNNSASENRTGNFLQSKADSAAAFCKKKNMNTDFCILIDMRIHSGKNRLFVWDFNKKETTFSGLCCHGAGGESTKKKPEFSNVPGSNCTSLGKYKIGIRSYSQWGIKVHYKMHGLEASNNNAYKRIVVLHSHTPVPENQIYPLHLPLGWSLGCPVVADKTMKYLDEKLKNQEKPVLMWIYY